jgi:hypothetical protein
MVFVLSSLKVGVACCAANKIAVLKDLNVYLQPKMAISVSHLWVFVQFSLVPKMMIASQILRSVILKLKPVSQRPLMTLNCAIAYAKQMQSVVILHITV